MQNETLKSNYADGHWHTVAVVYRGRKLRLYVDGELKLRFSMVERFFQRDVGDFRKTWQYPKWDIMQK